MKRTYIQPSTEVVTISTAYTLLGGSQEVQINNDSEASEWGSRRNNATSLWDDEEDDI